MATFATQASTTVGRLAPSPTGGLHLGHARTFLIAWLAARRTQGRILLRIEDLDASRVRPESRSSALDDLLWLGLDWDGDPIVQSQRIDDYAISLDRLREAGAVYPCTCTRADIRRAASAPHAEDEGPVYPGTCAGRSADDVEDLIRAGQPFAWRFRVPDGPITWDDLYLGPTSINPSRAGGDFIVGRDSIGPSYQLAVVHDDATMGVTQVIRGDDLVPSTPRQIALYEALGWSTPRFGHVPLAVGPDGRRLAKRSGSIRLTALRDAGVDPRLLVGWLACSCGWIGRATPSTPADWIDGFQLDTIPRQPWVVTPEDLQGLIRNQP